MNRNSKRYRQISIFDCFERNKRAKLDHTSMDKTPSNSKPSSAVKEKKVTSPSDSNASENGICQAAYDSIHLKSRNGKVVAGTSALEKDDQKQVTDGFSDDLFPEHSSVEDGSGPSTSHSEELFQSAENELFEGCSTSEEYESPPDTDEPDPAIVLNRSPDCCIPLPKLEPLENHTIMFSPHIRPGVAPRPYPSSYRDVWGTDHVRMPCSPQNKYPVEDARGEKHIESRWNLICQSLRADIGSSAELEEAILAYNSQYRGKWNFRGLHAFINKHWNEEERCHFFEVLLPLMVEMALNLPKICTQPIPLMKKYKDHYLTMSQKQIGCLLLNAFFCTFPRRTCNINRHSNKDREKWYSWEYHNYPDINFNRLFANNKPEIDPRCAEKLKCLFNYFSRITCAEPSGTVTFHRQCIAPQELPLWHTSTRGIRTVVIKSEGLIESDGHGMLQADFANKLVGGGVLGRGCVQEEIRFMICPDLIVSRLFVECLECNETLIITGVEQYNKYSGYADSFQWEGDFKDNTPRDPWGRRYTQIVAMDAIHFKSAADQFKFQAMKRELNKAYSAFYENAPPAHLPAVATGNWGCGAFRGNPNLKFLIQLMAASESGRSLLYFTFGNKKLKQELQAMYNFLCDKNLSVGDAWRLLMSYIDNVSIHNKRTDLYRFIYSQFTKMPKKKEEESSDVSLSDSCKTAAELLLEELKREESAIKSNA